tara:strand:- start:2242 stop:2937 length:696 start_codon:yes stop_codon:yes gene_type:complete
MKTFIVIPAYNEEKMIGSVLQNLKHHNHENIVVVDDGSKDNTSKVVKCHDVHLIRHIINRGQGASLQTGTEYALNQGADIIVHFDADGQLRPEEINKVTQPIKEKEVEATLGSRFLGQTVNLSKTKKLTLKGGILFTYFFSGIKLTDTHNGFRALSRNAASKITISQDKMAHASEIIDEIKNKKISFKEVPVTVIYTEHTKKNSKQEGIAGIKGLSSVKIALDLILKRFSK